MPNELVVRPSDDLSVLAAIDEKIAANKFLLYRMTKAENTLNSQRKDLRLFYDFIASQAPAALFFPPGYEDQRNVFFDWPGAWHRITAGLVETFKLWLTGQGYSISSIDRALSTVRTYADLAFAAQVLGGDEARRISLVEGYGKKGGQRLDQRRTETHRPGAKRPAEYTPQPIMDLLWDPDTYLDNGVGAMFRLIIALLYGHMMRRSEVCALKVKDIHWDAGTFEIFRAKTDTQAHTHQQDERVHWALMNYKPYMPTDPEAFLLRKIASIEDGTLGSPGVSTATLSRWLAKYIGPAVGYPQLASHFGRHRTATDAVRAQVPIMDLMHAAGWKSMNTAARYADHETIQNDAFLRIMNKKTPP